MLLRERLTEITNIAISVTSYWNSLNSAQLYDMR